MTPRSVKPEVPILRHVIPSTDAEKEEEEEEEKRRNSGRRKRDPVEDWVWVLKLYPGTREDLQRRNIQIYSILFIYFTGFSSVKIFYHT